MNSHLGHSRAWIPAACSPTAALLHRCFLSNLSTTTQGAIVTLRGASSELCTLFIGSCRTVKLRLPTVRKLFWGMLGRGDGGLRGIGVSGSGYNEVLALEVLNVIDCVERKRRADLTASASAPCAFAAAPSFQACLCACICIFCMNGRLC